MAQHVCEICAKGEMGCESCCKTPFAKDEENPGFWLTFKDIARIVKKTGLDPSEFCRLEDVPEGEEEDEDADEVYGELVGYGDGFILMNRSKNNTCYFLGENGCKIFDVRPKMCRVYPFWFEEKCGEIKIKVQHEDKLEDDDCYLTKSNYKNFNLKYLLSLMNETEEGFKKMVEEYIEEMKEHDKIKSQLKNKSIKGILEDNNLLD